MKTENFPLAVVTWRSLVALISKVGKEDMVLFQKNLTNRQSRRLVESRERGKRCLCFLPPLNPILGDFDFILDGIKEFFLQSLPPSSTIPSASTALNYFYKVLLILLLFPWLCSFHFSLPKPGYRDFRIKHLQYRQTFLLLTLTTSYHNLMYYYNFKNLSQFFSNQKTNKKTLLCY